MASKEKGRAIGVASYPPVMSGLLLLFLSLTNGGSKGVSGCDTALTITQLMPCLPAVKANPQPPSQQCCRLINNTPADCLCDCLKSPMAKLGGVDLEIALQLPRKCSRVVPPGAKCGGFNIPGSTEDQ
ncbi:unnamed protein product [Calypogeia fissa]